MIGRGSVQLYNLIVGEDEEHHGDPISISSSTTTDPMSKSAGTTTIPMFKSSSTTIVPIPRSKSWSSTTVSMSKPWNATTGPMSKSSGTTTDPMSKSSKTTTDSMSKSSSTTTESLTKSSGTTTEPMSKSSGMTTEPMSISSDTTTNPISKSSSTTPDPMSKFPNGTLRRKISSWDKGRLLGTGSYGSVFEGIADGGFFFAVKELSLLDQGEKGKDIINQFEQETAFFCQFEHKNIVRYLGTDKDDSKLYIFLELVPQGSLLSLYQRFHLQDSHVSVYTRQILEGLKYLHDHNVVHRDIKCANILLDVDGYVKLADFGLAKVVKLNDAKSCKGTPYWMAPEVVKPHQSYGRPADIWSLGCTVLEILTGNFPYHPLDGFQAIYKIGNGEPPPVPEFLSRDARDFILKYLQVDQDVRPSAADLLDHPFVKRPHSSSASASNNHYGMRD